MKCPYCNSEDTQVKDSRSTDDDTAIRRRRHCSDCMARFTTFERIQLREVFLEKRNGKQESFDRNKLAISIQMATRRRNIDPDRLDRIVNSIQRQIESMGETKIKSKQVGEIVMDALRKLDTVAYVRFASVYRNFREVQDFEDFIADELRLEKTTEIKSQQAEIELPLDIPEKHKGKNGKQK